MAARTERTVALIGLLTNLVVLGLVLAMVLVLDQRPLSALGLGLDGVDLALAASSVLAMAALAAIYLISLRAAGRGEITRRSRPERTGLDVTGGMLLTLLLFVVALQEEMLFRGYIALNLLRFGWGVVAVTSILVFTAIHLVTNRADLAQVASWTVGGALFVLAYLVSGSLWVAIVVHFAADLLNVVAFGIVGPYTFWSIEPALSGRWRASYRVVSSAAIALILILGYGIQIDPELRQQAEVSQA